MTRKAMVLTVAAAVFAASAAVMADVILNPDGTGFVGKGDVQSAFGWNNAQLQANAHLVTFSVTATQARTQECTTTGTPPHVVVSFRQAHRGLAGGIAHHPRVRNQITGFILDGFSGDDGEWGGWGPWQDEHGVSNIGSDCPAGSTPQGPHTHQDPVVSGLTATFNGVSVQLQ
jgi:hypothetical protein